MKYLGNDLAKEVKVLYRVNYKTEIVEQNQRPK